METNFINTLENLNFQSDFNKEIKESLRKLKLIVLSSTTSQIRSIFNSSNIRYFFNVLEQIFLKSDRKADHQFVLEIFKDILFYVYQSFYDEEFYEKFSSSIKLEILSEESNLKSICLNMLFYCSKNDKIRRLILNDDNLYLIIDSLNDEKSNKHAKDILIYASSKDPSFLVNLLNEETNKCLFESIKIQSESSKLRYFELIIDLALLNDENLSNSHIQIVIKELLDLIKRPNQEQDLSTINDRLTLINRLIENGQAVKFLCENGYSDFVCSKIMNPNLEQFINQLMPCYLNTFAKMYVSFPALILNYPDTISRIIELILNDEFMSSSIESLGLIGSIDEGKLILNSNRKFGEQLLPKLGSLLNSGQFELEILKSLANLFNLDNKDKSEEILNILENWNSNLNEKQISISSLSFELFNRNEFQVRIYALNLIKALCTFEWAQTEFVKIKGFKEFILSEPEDNEYQLKRSKINILKVLFQSSVTIRIFGSTDYLKIFRLFKAHKELVETKREDPDPRGALVLMEDEIDDDVLNRSLAKRSLSSFSYSDASIENAKEHLVDNEIIETRIEEIEKSIDIKITKLKNENKHLEVLLTNDNAFDKCEKELRDGLDKKCKVYNYPEKLLESTNEYLIQTFVSELIECAVLNLKNQIKEDDHIVLRREESLSHPKYKPPKRIKTDYKIQESDERMYTHGRCEFIIKKFILKGESKFELNIFFTEVKLNTDVRSSYQTYLQMKDAYLRNKKLGFEFTVYGMLTDLENFYLISFDGKNFKISNCLQNCVSEEIIDKFRRKMTVNENLIKVLRLLCKILKLSIVI